MIFEISRMTQPSCFEGAGCMRNLIGEKADDNVSA